MYSDADPALIRTVRLTESCHYYIKYTQSNGVFTTVVNRLRKIMVFTFLVNTTALNGSREEM